MINALKNERYFMNAQQKKIIIDKVTAFLRNLQEILFAVVYGSFVEDRPFRDIDVAVFVDSGQVRKAFLKYEIELEMALEEVIGFPVDVRLLNQAPIPFRYSVLKNGQVMFSRDGDVYADFVSRTLSSYFDFAPYRRRYLKEVLGIEI